ncbi:LacI family DNA-binding transcriptional regulator [Clostridium sp. BL-8]|uniref:LacI family DNA-binding transcriptional regulator n=1 Tax=Clostridium sp. BL-8 TaxID=349938 RepID=UPI00098C1A83|nr:LacI family DNA-binding transcriptional regulator [Clostridium sp. BL-8]OOM77355.1 HTH-type transcriptional repressor PurR [Clostridium sp. BL-8]
MKTIMQDIAKLAGVSPGTVSNALNDRKGVGKETKTKIIKIAEELGYFRNHKKNEEKVMRLILFKKHGYVVSDTQFFSALLEACENECRQNGYELLISQVIHGEHDKENVFKIINQGKIDGILLLATEMNEEDFCYFENLDIPVVVLDSYFALKSYDYVVINNTSGSYRAAKYFIDNGHERIGMVGSSVNISNFEYRYKGFRKAIEESGLKFKQEDEILVEPTLEGAYRDMKKYLEENKGKELPTALFAFNDIIALGAMRAMQEQDINVPKDISIIGFDDIPFSSLSNPNMTTIKVYTEEMGSIAVRRLIDKINDEDESITLKIEIDTKLIERNSVAKIVK